MFLDAAARRVHAVQEHERLRRTRTVTVLSILLVLALIAAGIAFWQQQQAIGAHRTTVVRGMPTGSATKIPGVLFNSASQLGSSTPARKPT